MKKDPKVSIVMAVHNGGPYLRETCDSIRRQSFDEWEFVAVDDCSTDRTWNILQEFSHMDSRVRPFRMEKKTGQTACLNYGLDQINGKYIARIDGDDVMREDRLKKQYEFLESNPLIGVVGSDVDSIDEDGKWMCTYRTAREDSDIRSLLIKLDPIFHPAVMFRAELLSIAGSYDQSYLYAQDYDLWIRFSAHTQFANVPEPLTKYRVLSTSISRASVRGQAAEDLLIRLRAIRRHDFPLSAVFHFWRPLIYICAPKWLVRRRFLYRNKRDRICGEFVIE